MRIIWNTPPTRVEEVKKPATPTITSSAKITQITVIPFSCQGRFKTAFSRRFDQDSTQAIWLRYWVNLFSLMIKKRSLLVSISPR